jgi:lipid-A-disaccharide synthase
MRRAKDDAPPGAGVMQAFVVAGEPSGERQGAALAAAIRELDPGARISGVGGHAMAAAGVELFCRSVGWAAIGVGEALKKVPALWLKFRAIRRHLRRHPPDVLILIDFGAFNLRLARAVQGSGIPILYYFPPRSWSREPPTGQLTNLVDAIATPFPWSERVLSGGRAQVRWVGHPLVEQVRPRLSADEARRRWSIDAGERVIAIAPGSRGQELRYLAPQLAGAARLLKASTPSLRFVVSVAPGRSHDLMRRRFRRVGIEPILIDGLDPDALQLAEVALVTSGTATLELAILGIPMVVVYKVSPTSQAQYAILRRMRGPLRFIAMPNVIAQRHIVPELLQERARADLIADEARRMLDSPQTREQIRRDLLAVAAELGPPGATNRAAEMALALARTKHVAEAVGRVPEWPAGAPTDSKGA